MFHVLRRRSLLGALVGALMLGGWALQPVEALAGFGTSPGPRLQSSALAKGCTSGDHIKEVVIEF
ncbi:MAG: hypothetical protein ACJ789_01525 [Thermomicrobiales bacterium]